MSDQLYEVLSLSFRYLFALLGVLIVLRAFFWLLSDRLEKRARLQKIPYAGTIGELVVLSGDRDLPEGQSIPVPWEGILGSVRSADLYVPCEGIRRSHLSFSFEPSHGLLIHPLSGCEVQVNGALLNCHSRPEESPMTHGSFLQVGSALLRLRVFAGLDPSAGFDDGSVTPAGPVYPGQIAYASFDESSVTPASPVYPVQTPAWNESFPDTSFDDQVQVLSPFAQEPTFQDSSPRRTRCSDRWESDWSE